MWLCLNGLMNDDFHPYPLCEVRNSSGEVRRLGCEIGKEVGELLRLLVPLALPFWPLLLALPVFLEFLRCSLEIRCWSPLVF